MTIRCLMTGVALAALGVYTPVFAIAAESDSTPTIEIIAKAQTRQVQTISADAIKIEVPGTSPLKAIEKLPGVSFQSADPFGAYEWSTRISIRGFNQNQLGFTLDDVPLGDMSYGNLDGLHISRAISSENVGRVAVTQGAGALGTASTNNLGGTVQFYSRNPSDEMGGSGAFTGGSDNTLRGFLRLETGKLSTGTKAYLSYGQSEAQKWKGDGDQKQKQANLKVVQDVGEGELTGFFNWSDRRENDYQDLSLSMIGRLGYGWDNFRPNWPLAVAVANGARPAPITTLDDSYYDASGLRKDYLTGLTFDYPLTDNLNFKTTVYGHKNEGQGIWFTPYTPTPGGAPISIRTTEYDLKRYGLIADLTWTTEGFLGRHAVNGGVWLQRNDFKNARRYYGLDATGTNRFSLSFQEDPFKTDWAYDFHTNTAVFHLQDSWKPIDRLTINYGFKSIRVTNSVQTITAAASGALEGSLKADNSFLPQAGFAFDVAPNHQIVGNYAKNLRAFQSAATVGPFSTTALGLSQIRNSLKPEESRTFEVGWRGRFGALQTSITGYDVKFEDRLLGVTVGSGIQGFASALQNVGSVTTRGVEAAAIWGFLPNWSLFGSYSYNHSTYDNNTVDATGKLVALTQGKTTVDSPENLARLELSFDNQHVFGKLGASYTGARYYTYTNDQKVNGYTVVDLSLGYRFSGSAWVDGTELQLNVTNLLDKNYVSTVGSNGFVNADPSGTFQTLLAGAPRQVFVTVRRDF